MKGERQIKTAGGITVYFSRNSTIQFTNEDDMIILQLDPTDLSAIYGAYRQFERENIEDKEIKSNQ